MGQENRSLVSTWGLLHVTLGFFTYEAEARTWGIITCYVDKKWNKSVETINMDRIVNIDSQEFIYCTRKEVAICDTDLLNFSGSDEGRFWLKRGLSCTPLQTLNFQPRNGMKKVKGASAEGK